MVGPLSQGWFAQGSSGAPRALIPQPNDPKYLEFLADDNKFAVALQSKLSGLAPEAARPIVEAAQANVGNLTPEERAQVIESATTFHPPNMAGKAHPIIQTIERLANNQGYTGPDAGIVVGTTPTAGGGGKPITRGELLDNENFGNLVNQVFAAAGGVSSMPKALSMFGNGAPGSIFSGAPFGITTGVNIEKMSESERMAFLNEVAEMAKDGKIIWEEQAKLSNIAAIYSNNGDSEPAAVTVKRVFGKTTTISKDDLMENGTFEKQLGSMPMFGAPDESTEVKALKSAIATADYDTIGYEERVALIQAFNAATSDNKATAQEIAGLTKMLEDMQKSSRTDAPAPKGTTLSNGLVVSNNDVAKPGNFMSMVNAVLDRSGVTTSNMHPNGVTYYGATPFTNNQTTVPMLRSLDVAGLKPQERLEVLEMISQAASNGDVTYDEARAISERVRSFNQQGVH